MEQRSDEITIQGIGGSYMYLESVESEKRCYGYPCTHSPQH